MHIQPLPEDVSAVKPTRPADHSSRVGGSRAIISPVHPIATVGPSSTPTQRTVGPSSTPVKEKAVPKCCKDVQSYEFSYNMIRTLPRNRNLKYRKDGDIDNDPASRMPSFCDYNAAREAIRQAKARGQNHVHWRTSTAVDRELIKDGYHISNDMYDTIYWKGFDKNHLVYRDKHSEKMGNRETWSGYAHDTASSLINQFGTSGKQGTSGYNN